MKARKVYRDDEMSTATITDSNLSVNDSNTISEPPAYFYVWDPIPRRCLRCRMYKELQEKMIRNSQCSPFKIIDYFSLINPKEVTEEAQRQMVKLEKHLSDVLKKYNIKFTNVDIIKDKRVLPMEETQERV